MALRMDLRVDSFFCVVQYKNLQGGIKTSLKASYRHLQRNPFHNSLLKITIIVLEDVGAIQNECPSYRLVGNSGVLSSKFSL